MSPINSMAALVTPGTIIFFLHRSDQPYDIEAIFTGSATIVDGKPVIVYPGLCSKSSWPNCQTGTDFAVALPADLRDPLLVNWTKPSYNPIVNNTHRDPTTAWQTSTGEWRMTGYDTTVYTSTDFIHWRVASGNAGFAKGECPSFFPLPGGPSPSTGATHVHKASYGGKDWMQVGIYNEGGVGSSGNWTGVLPPVRIDAGDYYASKDFYDPKKDRRINWGWAKVPPASTQSLPRVVTWDEEIKQLVFAPAEELQQLQGDSIFSLVDQTVPAGGSLWLSDGGADQAGNQSVVNLEVQLPPHAATITLHVAAGRPSAINGAEASLGAGNVSTEVTFIYTPGEQNVTVTVGERA